MGITNTAVTNILLLEMNYPTYVGGIMAALSNLGFILFIAIFGNLADRMPRRKALRILLVIGLFIAFTRFIPLTTVPNLVVFGACHLVEGGITGLFWPIQQSYTIIAQEEGIKQRNRYIAGYNLGWNSGVIFGFLLGFFLVDFWGTNVICFWVNLITAGAMVLIVFTVVFDHKKDLLPKLPPDSGDRDREDFPTLEKVTQKPRPASYLFPVGLILPILLVHSFADGSLQILVPLKIKAFGLASAEVYLLSFFKYLIQTFSSVIGPRFRESHIHHFLLVCPILIAGAWILFGISSTFPLAILAVALSGLVQGFLYANGMKAITQKTTEINSSKLFAYFQFTMGFGRMSGPFVMGILAGLAFAAGLSVLVVFGITMSIIGTIFYIEKRGLEKKENITPALP